VLLAFHVIVSSPSPLSPSDAFRCQPFLSDVFFARQFSRFHFTFHAFLRFFFIAAADSISISPADAPFPPQNSQPCHEGHTYFHFTIF
jgi:hypothetical protein